MPAKAIKGLKLKDQTKNENQIYNLTYNHKDFLAIKLKLKFITATSLPVFHHLMHVFLKMKSAHVVDKWIRYLKKIMYSVAV